MHLTVFRAVDGDLQAQDVSVPATKRTADAALRALGLSATVTIANGSANVALSSATDAEVLSTALLVTPEAERTEILAGYPGASAIEILYEPHNQFIPRIQWRYETAS